MRHRAPIVGDLTYRQLTVLAMYSVGYSTKAIMQELGISADTVKSHRKAIMQKLHTHNFTHAVAKGIREQMID